MSDERPYFRFFPTAYEAKGIFERSNAQCDACGRPAQWLYVGPIYTTVRPEPKLCAPCIADGSAASVLGSDYGFHDATFGDGWDQLPPEVRQRTPGFPTFNPFTWPAADNVPMAFLGYGDDPSFWNDANVAEAMTRFWREMMGGDLEGPTPYLLVFRSLDEQKFGFAVDLD